MDERGPAASLPDAVVRYLSQLETQRKLSPLTLKSYRADLAVLSRMAAAGTPAVPIENLRDVHVRRYAARLHAGGLAPRSLARALSSWRGFFDWRMRHEDGVGNPVADVRAPKLGKRLPKALSESMTGQLLDHPVAAAEDPLEIRDAAIRELFYSSGLRLTELVGLDVAPSKEAAGWIALAEGEVEVTGKGDKRRRVPVGSVAVAAIGRWLAVRDGLVRHEERALFLSERGGRLSGRSIQSRLKAAARVAGVPANVHPHVLRHSFASHMLQATGDLRAVQELLGHASIAATQVYTSLDFQHLAQVYDAAHPRARRK